MRSKKSRTKSKIFVTLVIILIIAIVGIILWKTIGTEFMRPKSGKIAEVVRVGDYINYNAGTWTKSEIEELKDLGLYSGEEFPTEQDKFHFGGFKEGDSRDEGISLFENGEKNSGWRVLNINSDGTVDIVHDGISEAYFNSTKINGEAENSLYILTEGREGKSGGYSARKWDMYENRYAVEDSAHCMTHEEIEDIQEEKKQKYFNLDNDEYWLASVAETTGKKENLWFVAGQCDYDWDFHDSGSEGIRIVLTIKAEVNVDRTTGKKNGVNVWNIQLPTEVQVGDYINYDAGKWTEDEINDLKKQNLYSTEDDGERYKFSGFEVRR